jgi:hypothetical protein
MTSGISTKDLQKARRNAVRKRASVACARCKAGKMKCSDYRPCKKCKDSDLAGNCAVQTANSRHDTSTIVLPITSLAPGFLTSRHYFPGPSRFESETQYTRDTHPPPSAPLQRPAPQTFLPPVATLIFGSAPPAATLSFTAHYIDNSLLLALRERLQAAVATPHPHRLAPIAALPPLLSR